MAQNADYGGEVMRIGHWIIIKFRDTGKWFASAYGIAGPGDIFDSFEDARIYVWKHLF